MSLVTGASGRIGRAIALALAEQGAAVAVHYNTSADGAERVVAAIRRKGGKSKAFQADLMDDTQRMTLIPKVKREMGTVSILINNSAIFAGSTMLDTKLKEWDDNFELNLKAPFRLSQSFAAQNRFKARGNIINISDRRALRPGTDHFAYTIAKSALVKMTEAMALALAPRIRVNCLALGAILLPAGASPKKRHQLVSQIPLERMGSAKQVVAAVLYLVEKGTFVTGETLAIDGGRRLAE